VISHWLSEDGPILCGGYKRAQTCCILLKEMVQARQESVYVGEKNSASVEEMEKLKLGIAQRDNEISILVQMINKKAAEPAEPKPAAATPPARVASPSRVANKLVSPSPVDLTISPIL